MFVIIVKNWVQWEEIGGSVFLFFYFLSLGFKYHKYSPIHAKCVVSDAPAY